MAEFEARWHPKDPPGWPDKLRHPAIFRDMILAVYTFHLGDFKRAREFGLSNIHNAELMDYIKGRLKIPSQSLGDMFFHFIFNGFIAGLENHVPIPGLREQLIEAMGGGSYLWRIVDIDLLLLQREFRVIVDFYDNLKKYSRYTGKHYLDVDYTPEKDYYEKIMPEWEFAKALVRDDMRHARLVLDRSKRIIEKESWPDWVFGGTTYHSYIIMHDILNEIDGKDDNILIPVGIKW
jgi:hypothetical protein